MNDNYAEAAYDPKRDAAEYVTEREERAEPGLNQLHDLLDFLQDTYPDDDALRILEWRAISAISKRTGAIATAEEGILRAEMERVERWTLYLEGKGDPDGAGVRSLWNGLSACFNPQTGELEEWFFGDEANALSELRGRYGCAPEGEPPAIFS